MPFGTAQFLLPQAYGSFAPEDKMPLAA